MKTTAVLHRQIQPLWRSLLLVHAPTARQQTWRMILPLLRPCLSQYSYHRRWTTNTTAANTSAPAASGSTESSAAATKPNGAGASSSSNSKDVKDAAAAAAADDDDDSTLDGILSDSDRDDSPPTPQSLTESKKWLPIDVDPKKGLPTAIRIANNYPPVGAEKDRIQLIASRIRLFDVLSVDIISQRFTVRIGITLTHYQRLSQTAVKTLFDDYSSDGDILKVPEDVWLRYIVEKQQQKLQKRYDHIVNPILILPTADDRREEDRWRKIRWYKDSTKKANPAKDIPITDLIRIDARYEGIVTFFAPNFDLSKYPCDIQTLSIPLRIRSNIENESLIQWFGDCRKNEDSYSHRAWRTLFRKEGIHIRDDLLILAPSISVPRQRILQSRNDIRSMQDGTYALSKLIVQGPIVMHAILSFKRQAHDEIRYEMDIVRNPTFHFFNLLLPVFILVVLNFCSFAVPVNDDVISNRLMITSTIALTYVAFKVYFAGKMPDLSYLTAMDRFMGIGALWMAVVIGYHAIPIAPVIRPPTVSSTSSSGQPHKITFATDEHGDETTLILLNAAELGKPEKDYTFKIHCDNIVLIVLGVFWLYISARHCYKYYVHYRKYRAVLKGDITQTHRSYFPWKW